MAGPDCAVTCNLLNTITHEDRDGVGSVGENGEENEGEKELGKLRSGNRGGIGRNTREGGRRQRVTSNHSRKTQEARGRIVEGGGEAKRRRKSQKSYRRDVENGVNLGGRRKQSTW